VVSNQSWKSKLSIWVRGNFFIPDARVFWVKPSVEFLKKYLLENDFEALVTTGPPHSMHLIGLELKKEFPDLKWIADFRDPWTEISYYKHLKLSTSADKKHRNLEKKVFQVADITLATSYTDAENFRKMRANAFCITNGFDGTTKEEMRKSSKFTLSYIGVLEQLRNPEILWKSLNELMAEKEDFQSDFVLKFVGRIDEKILAQIENTPLKNAVKKLGYCSHSEANLEMQNSDLLLITNFPEESSKGIIPGKIFEYLATGKQILSFGPKESDVQKILVETQAGQHFYFAESDDVKVFIWETYLNWKKGSGLCRTQNIEQFSRRNLTKKLSELL
jgi:glycosyltransferase involved in cell wall biosynthesis